MSEKQSVIREERRVARVEPINRMQMVMRTINIERLVEEDHPVRALWEFIGRMDLKSQSAGQMNRRGVDPEFRSEAFSYDPCSDTFTCPAGKVLTYEDKEECPGKVNYRYRAVFSECQACRFRDKCCPTATTKGRTIVRGVDHPVVVAFVKKMASEEAEKIYRTRGAVAEFPNAWIKDKIGLRQFHLRGLVKVCIEALWACLTYNLQQWIRLSWSSAIAN